VALVAASTATMLVLDAWFDVLTSRREDMASSVASAVLAELPLAVLCGWIALHADRVAERRLHQLTRRVARLQSGAPDQPDLGAAADGPVGTDATAVRTAGVVPAAAAQAVQAAEAANAIAEEAGQTADAATRAAERRLRG
jgi:hypothetical protein